MLEACICTSTDHLFSIQAITVPLTEKDDLDPAVFFHFMWSKLDMIISTLLTPVCTSLLMYRDIVFPRNLSMKVGVKEIVILLNNFIRLTGNLAFQDQSTDLASQYQPNTPNTCLLYTSDAADE